MYLFDTDTISNLLKRSPSRRLIDSLSQTPVEQQNISTITVAEMFFGAFRRDNGQTVLLNRLEELLPASFTILSFDYAAARIFGRIRAQVEGQGTPIGLADLQIGSIALAHDLTVVTGNVRHFTRIPSLRIENWLE